MESRIYLDEILQQDHLCSTWEKWLWFCDPPRFVEIQASLPDFPCLPCVLKFLLQFAVPAKDCSMLASCCQRFKSPCSTLHHSCYERVMENYMSKVLTKCNFLSLSNWTVVESRTWRKSRVRISMISLAKVFISSPVAWRNLIQQTCS